MKFELTTPALLFTAISLLISAYTTRFLNLAQLLRSLDIQYRKEKEPRFLKQIRNLNKRIQIIRYTQIAAAISFFLCVLSMFSIFLDRYLLGEITFGMSLIALLISLGLSIYEVQISVKAISVQIEDLEDC
ncbi:MULTISPECIES: DUF2721 domain-containing protein [Clostridium]|jgi:uncharacterized Tic20 family protein|uniref:DUF2721 domain-containing protein n=2 Tax=Clostridium intestinale TaxID=36845 RepID=U2NQZ8_9CLOT|nr:MULTISPECIES: DUF2721 domain-containing protein [Clostridium]ERK31311.1 hypothetical protein CINTURNW_1244 [Clostridium intestinale URNW]QLY78476.1 DUF2721 domain-containing protein [Clostridium intestinale]WRY53566.1 DUF2721 domain-containing protein [Clostridium intestinale]